MNSQEFCYWLRGYFEVTGDNVNVALTEEQVKIIKDHLSLVFKKVTPTYYRSFIDELAKVTTGEYDVFHPNQAKYC